MSFHGVSREIPLGFSHYVRDNEKEPEMTD